MAPNIMRNSHNRENEMISDGKKKHVSAEDFQKLLFLLKNSPLSYDDESRKIGLRKEGFLSKLKDIGLSDNLEFDYTTQSNKKFRESESLYHSSCIIKNLIVDGDSKLYLFGYDDQSRNSFAFMNIEFTENSKIFFFHDVLFKNCSFQDVEIIPSYHQNIESSHVQHPDKIILTNNKAKRVIVNAIRPYGQEAIDHLNGKQYLMNDLHFEKNTFSELLNVYFCCGRATFIKRNKIKKLSIDTNHKEKEFNTTVFFDLHEQIDSSLNDPKHHKKLFSELRAYAEKDDNPFLQRIYEKYERIYDVSYVHSIEDKFIFWWYRNIGIGVSITKCILVLFSIILFLTVVTMNLKGYTKIHLSSDSISLFINTYLDWLNPLLKLNNIADEEIGWTLVGLKVLFYFQKIALGLLSYEIVQSFRRFHLK